MAKRLLRVPILLFLKTGKKKSYWQYLTVTNGAWGWSGENTIALKLFWHILSFGSIQLRQIQDGVHLCEEKSNPIGQCVKYEWGWSITQIPEGKLKLSRQKATVQNTMVIRDTHHSQEGCPTLARNTVDWKIRNKRLSSVKTVFSLPKQAHKNITI